MNHFSKVDVPERVKQKCEQDKRGLYVPFVVLKEGDNFHFKINDTQKTVQCVKQRCCSVCGDALEDDAWFIAGPGSAFHTHGSIADLPVHKECGVYSLQVCPYLAYGRYTSKTDLDKLYKQLNDDSIKLVNHSVDQDRVPIFCFIKSPKYDVHQQPGSFNIVFKPRRPYEEVEFWYDGERVSDKDAEVIIKNYFAEKYELKYLDHDFQKEQKETM